MTVILGVLLVVVSILMPGLGVLLGFVAAQFTKKTNILAIVAIAVGIASFGMHYVYLKTDDMARYVAYMARATTVPGVVEYFEQMFGPAPISEYGLNGQSWPASGLVLYITSKFFNYKVLSAATLAFSAFIRIYAVFKVSERSSWPVRHLFFLRLTAVIILIAVMTFKLPVSGFRWYLATDLILLISIRDLTGNKFNSVANWSTAVVASLFHPAGWIYVAIRGFVVLFGLNAKMLIRILAIVVPVTLAAVYIWDLNILVSLIRQFLAYFSFDNFKSTQWMMKYYVGWEFTMALMMVRIFNLRNSIDKSSFENVLLNFLFTSVTVTFFLFQRLYPFTFTMMVFYWVAIAVKDNGFKRLDSAILAVFAVVQIWYVITVPGNFMPPLDSTVYEILTNPWGLE